MEPALFLEKPIHRAVWKVRKHGMTFYIHIPKDLAAIWGFSDSDYVDIGIYRIIKAAEAKGAKK